MVLLFWTVWSLSTLCFYSNLLPPSPIWLFNEGPSNRGGIQEDIIKNQLWKLRVFRLIERRLWCISTDLLSPSFLCCNEGSTSSLSQASSLPLALNIALFVSFQGLPFKGVSFLTVSVSLLSGLLSLGINMIWNLSP